MKIELHVDFRVLVLFFVEGGTPENPEKTPWCKDKNKQQTQLSYNAGSGIWIQDTLSFLTIASLLFSMFNIALWRPAGDLSPLGLGG